MEEKIIEILQDCKNGISVEICKDALLNLCGVSQQRELLLAFEEYCCKLEYLTPNYEMLEKHINNFLANNCG